MSGDYSRFTDRPLRRYTGVRMQQGRVQLDADWNEEVAILKRRWETQAEDTFGQRAVPEAATPDGFKVTPSGADLQLGAGRIYVHGRLAEIFPGEKVGNDPVSYLHQPFYPQPPALPGGPYVVYLDIWDREVTYIEDPDILEKALGGPDTAARIQTVWQVKVKGTGNSPAKCGADVGEPASTGQLSTRAIAPPAGDDPCILSPTGGYRGIENRLYRVEIHDTGATTHFKWSRENASVVSAVTGIGGASKELTVTRIGRDAVLRFQKDDWVEVTDDRLELKGLPGTMARVVDVKEATRTVMLDRAVSGFGATEAEHRDRHTRVRRWDQRNGVNADGLLAVAPATWIALEDGIQVRFTPKAGTFHTGDSWSFAARTVDGSVEELQEALPHGIVHAYCQLAAVSPGVAQPEDCRPMWPCECKVTEAPRPACCSLTVSPGEGWERVFKSFTKGQDVSVCFAPGTYRLIQTLELAELGQVKIEGAGAGTKILAPGLECALRFRNCRGVLVRDLAALTGIARSGKKTPKQHLNGTLTFEQCGPVTVSDVTLQCGGGDRRAAACITVMGKPGQPLRLRQGDGIRTWASFGGSALRTTRKVRGPLVPVLAEAADAQTGGTPVRIRGCELKVGRGQVGILVVDGQRIQIEDNNIAVVHRKQKPTYQNLIRGRSFRSGLRSQLISALQVNPQERKESPDSMTIEVGGHTVRFETAKTLRSAWSALLEKRPLAGPVTARDVARHLYALADEILLEGPASTEPLFRDQLLQFRRNIRPVASQGIVIGGRRAGDVRILNNSVSGVLQGVHLGLSHKRQPQAGPADLAGRVRISGNRIVLLLAAGVRRERHGIFLGSVDSAIVDDNHVQVVRFAGAEPPLRLQSVDGIRVFGWLGALLLVEHNHLVDCTTGVLVHAFNPPKDPKSVLRKITRNVLIEGGATVVASGIPQEDISDNRP